MTLPVRQESSSPVRWDPWREFESLTGQMNQLFESAFGQSGLAMGAGWPLRLMSRRPMTRTSSRQSCQA